MKVDMAISLDSSLGFFGEWFCVASQAMLFKKSGLSQIEER